MARLLDPALTLAACLGVWAAYGELAILRASVLWDLRYVVLGVVAILMLSLAEWISAALTRRLDGKEKGA